MKFFKSLKSLKAEELKKEEDIKKSGIAKKRRIAKKEEELKKAESQIKDLTWFIEGARNCVNHLDIIDLLLSEEYTPYFHIQDDITLIKESVDFYMNNLLYLREELNDFINSKDENKKPLISLEFSDNYLYGNYLCGNEGYEGQKKLTQHLISNCGNNYYIKREILRTLITVVKEKVKDESNICKDKFYENKEYCERIDKIKNLVLRTTL